MKPLVTVGVCVRNSASTIREAVESITVQDFPHESMEIIFVDDGSEDTTLAIIRWYAARVDMDTKVFHQSWQGLGISRNLVVDNARGRYIVWVDGDMILPADHVRKQVEFMEPHPEVGIAKARYGVPVGENLISFLENISYVAVDQLYDGKPVSKTLGTGGSIYRVEAIRQVGGFDKNISGVGEDMDAEHRTRAAGWLLYRGSPAVFFERRRKSLVAVWRESFWHGHGGHLTFRKNRRVFSIYKMTPLVAFVAAVLYANVAYKTMRKKIVFLLPLQYTFKSIAWLFGFMSGQLDV